jgi:DNA polymerase III epsilon subunit-like protein
VFDVETTGIDPRVHQIVSIGALLLDRKTLEPVQSMSTLVRLTPEAFAQASPRAMQIHGLKLDQLEVAPTPAEVVTQFLDTFGADFYFCGWNICFDTQFLRALFDQAGRLEDFDKFGYHKLDLWSLLETAWLGGQLQARPASLSIACGLFGIARASVHDAMEDARVTALILRKSLLLLVAGQKEGNMDPSGAASKSGDEKPPAPPIASLEGTLDLRYLLVGWRMVAHNGTDGHYDAQRRFNRRGRWLGGFATLLTTLTGAAVIKQVSTAIPDPKINAVMAILAAIAVVLTALHTYLAYEARAANHRSTAAGYAAALRKIDEAIIFGYASASEAQKAADEIRLSLDALSRDAPEVPKDILEKYAKRVDNPPPAARPTAGAA